MPAFGGCALSLVHHHPIAGEWQWVVVPIGAPVRGFGDVTDGLAEATTVGEAPARQCGQALGKGSWPLGPCPDKQANAAGIGVAQLQAVHQAGHFAAGIKPAVSRLHMAVEPPIEFTLQHQVDGVRQLLDNARDLACGGGPVVAHEAIAPADDLSQATFLIDQGHRHAIHLGLNPDIFACSQPGADGLFILQFLKTCMGNGMRPGAA